MHHNPPTRPHTMAACLSVMTRLKLLVLDFQFSQFLHRQTSQPPPPSTPITLPSHYIVHKPVSLKSTVTPDRMIGSIISVLIGVVRDDARILQKYTYGTERTKVTRKKQGMTSIKPPHRPACSVSPSHSRCPYGWWRTAASWLHLGHRCLHSSCLHYYGYQRRIHFLA